MADPKHNKTPRYRTPEYKAWDAARRAGPMCAEWAADFGVFLRDMGPRPSGFVLCRSDCTLSYAPGNCRWGTWEEHAAGKNKYKSKHYKKREYWSWQNARNRCHNPNAQAWPSYGGRGITMCDRWRESFDAFFADMGPCPTDYTLDRLNNDLGYEPSNCAWRAWSDQNSNKRSTKRYSSIDGPALTITEAAQKAGLPVSTISSRLARGVMASVAISEPARPRERILTHNGETHSLSEWAIRMNLPFRTLHSRLQRGWSLERALITPRNQLRMAAGQARRFPGRLHRAHH